MKINERLVIAVQQSGMKKKDIAAAAGMSQVTLSKYLSGAYVPKMDNLTKLANALNIDVAQLLFEQHDESTRSELEAWRTRAITAERKLAALREALPLITRATDILGQYLTLPDDK